MSKIILSWLILVLMAGSPLSYSQDEVDREMFGLGADPAANNNNGNAAALSGYIDACKGLKSSPEDYSMCTKRAQSAVFGDFCYDCYVRQKTTADYVLEGVSAR
ncbi:MAG: hypothetical protein U0T83_00450 [Bacteriovoracaceae bacterium]